ncbi:hypothetical protein DFH06DRAFT_1209199 [Mycena polygramma]|nr:hypothetical protein DFH06DRAFT_1209199 [Mycena polygramma]
MPYTRPRLLLFDMMPRKQLASRCDLRSPESTGMSYVELAASLLRVTGLRQLSLSISHSHIQSARERSCKASWKCATSRKFENSCPGWNDWCEHGSMVCFSKFLQLIFRSLYSMFRLCYLACLSGRSKPNCCLLSLSSLFISHRRDASCCRALRGISRVSFSFHISSGSLLSSTTELCSSRFRIPFKLAPDNPTPGFSLDETEL